MKFCPFNHFLELISGKYGWKKRGEQFPEEKDGIYLYVNSHVGRTITSEESEPQGPQ